MNLENQIVSLDLSKRLKELGVKQQSYFKYELRSERPLYFEIYHSKATSCAHEYYSAYTVAELGNLLLPLVNEIETEILDDNFYRLATYKIYQSLFDAKTEADARAKMLIHLIENNLIDENNPIFSKE